MSCMMIVRPALMDLEENITSRNILFLERIQGTDPFLFRTPYGRRSRQMGRQVLPSPQDHKTTRG